MQFSNFGDVTFSSLFYFNTFLIADWIFFFKKDKPSIIIWGSVSVEYSDCVCVSGNCGNKGTYCFRNQNTELCS